MEQKSYPPSAPKWWITYVFFLWWWRRFDVLLHHESRGDSRERARAAHSLFNPFNLLTINELLLLRLTIGGDRGGPRQQGVCQCEGLSRRGHRLCGAVPATGRRAEEIIDELTSQNYALRQQVEELKQCLATCHAMRSQAMNFNNKVDTVVAHADQVTLQYQAS